MAEPNVLKVLAGIVKVLLTTSRPMPLGTESYDHSALKPVLSELEAKGLAGVVEARGELTTYLKGVADVDPNLLNPSQALAFWINLYNAGVIELAIDALEDGRGSVLGVPGGFSRPTVDVKGERLSLDAIEHGKVRRFKDPRIHGALVCGSLSCPTLQADPYEGDDLDTQLDNQMRAFLGGGGAVAGEEARQLALSRIFLWYGPDFVRPRNMPAFLPVSKARLRSSIEPWLSPDLAERDQVVFQSYDWSLACTIG